MNQVDVLQTPAGRVAATLIGFDTVSHKNNTECAAYVADWLKKRKARVSVLREHFDGEEKVQLLGVVGPRAEGGLLISAHMDVVPFADQPGWDSDPLKLTLKNDRLVARGICDMKGFLANCLTALDELDQSRLRHPVLFAFTCDEEIACQGSHRFAANFRKLLDNCPPPAAGWFGEPTEFATFHAQKGYSYFTLTIKGRGGHSSRPDRALNAISVMGDILRIIHTMNMEYHARTMLPEVRDLFPEYPYESINPAIIAGGISHNMVADRCDLTISYRTLPGTPPDAVLRSLQTRIERSFNATAQMRNAIIPEAVYSELITAPAMSVPPDGPLPEALMEATGCSLAGGAPYVTDAGHFAPIGFPCYICGPGELHQAHQPNESLPVAHFLKTQKVILSVIEKFCC